VLENRTYLQAVNYTEHHVPEQRRAVHAHRLQEVGDVAGLLGLFEGALGVPAMRATFASRLAERRLYVYETRGEEHTGRGAIIACIDCPVTLLEGVDCADRAGEELLLWASLVDQVIRKIEPKQPGPGTLHRDP
jgi:hypothetical protein